MEAADAGVVAADPLGNPDWDALLGAQARSTTFHAAGWARVLSEIYGHRPFYLVRFEGKEMAGLLPIMEVSSRLTGRRGVSLPFSDSCPPLGTAERQGQEFYQRAKELGCERGWKYLECRGHGGAWEGSTASLSFYGHTIDLSVGEKKLFQGLEGALRRGVRKAEEAGLRVDFGTGEESVRTYFALHCRTRRRHGVPPQPFKFFQSIQRHILGGGKGFIAIARLGSHPVAAAVFFCHGRQACYKFGASDYAFQRMRPNNLVMWEGMKRCAERGLRTLNLGRTSLSNEGLRRFKLGLGAVEEEVQYARYDFSAQQFVRDMDRAEGWHNRVFGILPPPLLRLMGAMLYPHLS
jgi:hypothetical protein